jgi:hypothetical protein
VDLVLVTLMDFLSHTLFSLCMPVTLLAVALSGA